MPTYGRPTLVQNAIACFLAQDYPADRRRLLIFDDAGQIAPQSGEGWTVWSTSVRAKTLAAKYVELNRLDAGWADAFVIWDDDDIYLPWHLSAHAAALQKAQWSHPVEIWSLAGGTPTLARTGGGYWASSAVRVELLNSVGGFVQSERADFDQANLRAWRDHGGAPGRPERPSFVYGWGRSKHVSSLMISPDNKEWYSKHKIGESRRVERITPAMDAQTQDLYKRIGRTTEAGSVFGTATGGKTDLSPSRPASIANDGFADPYDLVRALLVARDAPDRDIIGDVAERTVLRCPPDLHGELWRRLPDEAEYHGVAPLLEPMISSLAKQFPEAVPDDVRLTFVALASRHRRAANAREECIDQLLAAFEAAGIRIILLKGTALAHLVYGAPELRPMVDIDALIEPSDLKQAVATLCDLGYSFETHHPSRFSGRMHHVPAATVTKSGFRISLELHLDAMAPDTPERLTFATLSEKPRPFPRGAGPQGLALGHTDMLRHLVRHTFEPARRVRLKHLYDLSRYQAIFGGEIDWSHIDKRFPHVSIGLQLVSCIFPGSRTIARRKVPPGVGEGMATLSEIARMPFPAMMTALFNPSPWWLHGHYGVPPGSSLLVCRAVRHPLTLAGWLARRLAAGVAPPPAFNAGTWTTQRVSGR
jgi:hypothetical protein